MVWSSAYVLQSCSPQNDVARGLQDRTQPRANPSRGKIYEALAQPVSIEVQRAAIEALSCCFSCRQECSLFQSLAHTLTLKLIGTHSRAFPCVSTPTHTNLLCHIQSLIYTHKLIHTYVHKHIYQYSDTLACTHGCSEGLIPGEEMMQDSKPLGLCLLPFPKELHCLHVGTPEGINPKRRPRKLCGLHQPLKRIQISACISAPGITLSSS